MDNTVLLNSTNKPSQHPIHLRIRLVPIRPNSIQLSPTNPTHNRRPIQIQLQRLDGILSDLRKNQRIIINELAGKPGVTFAPSNDPEGDCGVVVAFNFETEALARKFVTSPGVSGGLPIDSGRHVYTNWDPIIAKRSGTCDAFNAFKMPENQDCRMDYSDDMCSTTLDILSRTVCVGIDPDWTEEQALACAEACRKAAAAL
jgi:hypothetical protein